MTGSRAAVVTLPADTQILITRDFDAPRHLVFLAWTTPELIMRWWSGGRGEVTTVEVDLRPGGSWRYVMMADGGTEAAFHGEYREIVPDERIVSTEVYEDVPDAEAVTTLTLTETDGRTRLTMLVQHTSRENRDRHLEYGDGLQQAMDRLERAAISASGCGQEGALWPGSSTWRSPRSTATWPTRRAATTGLCRTTRCSASSMTSSGRSGHTSTGAGCIRR
jgi:uncharacterized protein YndB with AHSA1/START domain